MKRRWVEASLAVLMTAVCLNVTGCSGIIQPRIGESGIATSAGGENAGGDGGEMAPEEGGTEKQSEGGESFGGPGEGFEGSSGAGEQETEQKPEMSGAVQAKFETSKETSNGRGGMMTLTATIELYDAENADGYNALIDIKLDEKEKYTPCTWSEENGQYTLAIDEFTIYTSKEVEGVLMIVGVRYEFGMEGKGTLDIPLVEAASEKKAEEAVTEAETEAAETKAAAEKAAETEEMTEVAAETETEAAKKAPEAETEGMTEAATEAQKPSGGEKV